MVFEIPKNKSRLKKKKKEDLITYIRHENITYLPTPPKKKKKRKEAVSFLHMMQQLMHIDLFLCSHLMPVKVKWLL